MLVAGPAEGERGAAIQQLPRTGKCDAESGASAESGGQQAECARFT